MLAVIRFPRCGGWRAHGRGAGSIRRDRNTKVGFDYVHSERASAYFAAPGITRIDRLMTDNAWAYRYSLRRICALGGLPPISRP